MRRSHSAPRFEDLVGRNLREFVEEYWERAPLLTRAALEPSQLLTLDELDWLVTCGAHYWPTSVAVVGGGQSVHESAFTVSAFTERGSCGRRGDPFRLMERLAGGDSLVFYRVHRLLDGVRALCDRVRSTLSHPVGANCYITPPEAAALGLHYDLHDVFVIQVIGSKEWMLYEAVEPLPLDPCRVDESQTREIAHLVLTPGDVVYVPRGIVHRASAFESLSVHLTIGIDSQCLMDLVFAALIDASKAGSLRTSLPPGFANAPHSLPRGVVEEMKRALDEVAARLEDDEFLHSFAESYWQQLEPSWRGRFAEMACIGAISDRSSVAARFPESMRVEPREDSLVISTGPLKSTLPPGIESAASLVGEGRAFGVRELTDRWGSEVGMALARELVRQGILRVEQW